MGIAEKLMRIQEKLKVPKSQENKFGGYNYRSCEDIMEAVKKLCVEEKALLTVTDDLVCIEGRFYIKAKASLIDCESDGTIYTTAFAREAESRKGMDESQVTGSASSYARKYALNGLFCIDDTKDADTMDNREMGVKRSQTSRGNKVSAQQQNRPQNGNQGQKGNGNGNANRNKIMIDVVKRLRADEALNDKAQILIEEMGHKSINDLSANELMQLRDKL